MTHSTRPKHAEAQITLLSDTEAKITRTFNAPRALVWEAMTKPEHVRHWYGPYSTRITECAMDVRVGGKWRLVMESEQGGVVFSGEYLEVRAPERIVQTWRFEPIPDASSIETMTLEERGATTLMTTIVKHTSKENLQGHLQSGMEAGMRETYQRLDELLEKLAA